MRDEETPIQKANREADDRKYRTITRGPHKGKRVRKTRAELRRESLERMAAERETIIQRVMERHSSPKKEAELGSSWDFTIVWIFLGLCGLYGLYFVIGYSLLKLNASWLFFFIVAADLLGDRLYKRPTPSRKYVPFLWMFR